VTDKFPNLPAPAYRSMPSKYPPIGAFDTISTAADLLKIMELED